jgi:hypothetical protein
MVYLSYYRRILGWYLKIGPDHFLCTLSNLSFSHPTIRHYITYTSEKVSLNEGTNHFTKFIDGVKWNLSIIFVVRNCNLGLSRDISVGMLF